MNLNLNSSFIVNTNFTKGIVNKKNNETILNYVNETCRGITKINKKNEIMKFFNSTCKNVLSSPASSALCYILEVMFTSLDSTLNYDTHLRINIVDALYTLILKLKELYNFKNRHSSRENINALQQHFELIHKKQIKQNDASFYIYLLNSMFHDSYNSYNSYEFEGEGETTSLNFDNGSDEVEIDI